MSTHHNNNDDDVYDDDVHNKDDRTLVAPATSHLTAASATLRNAHAELRALSSAPSSTNNKEALTVALARVERLYTELHDATTAATTTILLETTDVRRMLAQQQR